MLEKRRSGRASTKTSIEGEIAHLRDLDLKGLRSRWQSVFHRPPPDHLPRHLLFAIITYRIQADRLGDSLARAALGGPPAEPAPAAFLESCRGIQSPGPLDAR
jgi:hypothetical protein